MSNSPKNAPTAEPVEHVFTVSETIATAVEMNKQYDDLRERIAANRELCKLLIRNNLTTAEQTAGIEAVYPSGRGGRVKPAPAVSEPDGSDAPADGSDAPAA